jgi:transcriptional regulator with XRE-family HTH domain
MMKELLPTRLRVLRAERGLTLRAAAKLTGVAKETLSDLERGRRHPHDPTLAKIAKGYDMPVEELLRSRKEGIVGLEDSDAGLEATTSPKDEAPSSPETTREERRTAEAALRSWVEYLDLTLARAHELRGEIEGLGEYTKTEGVRDPVAGDQQIQKVFSRCLEFSEAVASSRRAYLEHIGGHLEGKNRAPWEGELLEAINLRFKEILPITQGFLDVISRARRMSVDVEHAVNLKRAEEQFRDLGQELRISDRRG